MHEPGTHVLGDRQAGRHILINPLWPFQGKLPFRLPLGTSESTDILKPVSALTKCEDRICPSSWLRTAVNTDATTSPADVTTMAISPTIKAASSQVVGTTSLYENGQIRLIPVSDLSRSSALLDDGKLTQISGAESESERCASRQSTQTSVSSRVEAHQYSDPLNLPQWRRWAAIGSLCFCELPLTLHPALVASRV